METTLKQQGLNRLCGIISRRLDELKHYFVPQMKLTFVARHPTDSKAFLVFTDEENISEVTNLLLEQERIHKESGV